MLHVDICQLLRKRIAWAAGRPVLSKPIARAGIELCPLAAAAKA